MTATATFFRTAAWLGQGRALAWIRLLTVASVLTASALLVLTHGGRLPDPWGRPLGADFSSFWTAARLALAGTPGAPWEPTAHAAAQRASFLVGDGFEPDYYAFFYPPPFLLICLPFGLLPYGLALIAWIGLTGVAFLTVLRAMLPRCWPALLAGVGFPAFMLNAMYGQNGALSAALFATAAVWLDRQPWLAGACLGTLCYKPQLVLLVGPALVCARRWRALAGAAGAVVLLCMASLLILGGDAWRGFFVDSALARAALEQGLVEYGKMSSTFAGLRLLGARLQLAWTVQAAVALATLAVVVAVAWRRPGGPAEMAVTATGTCLATPFLLGYDLTLLAVPLAWVVAEAAHDGFLPWERLVLAAGYLLALFSVVLALNLGLPAAPLVVAALLIVVCRRALSRHPGGRGAVRLSQEVSPCPSGT